MTTAEITTVGGFERHLLPSGIEVFYRDTDHAYYSAVKTDDKTGKTTGVKDARLTGISTVVAPYDWRPDSLMAWSGRLTCDGVAALAAEGLGCDDPEDMRASLRWLTSGEAVMAGLTDARLRWQDTRDDAAHRGTNVHLHALHALAQGERLPAYDSMTEEEKGYAAGVAACFLDHEIVPLVSEQVVCDPGLGVAGRLDLLCTLDGATVVLDAKTSRFVANKHHVQLAGYAHCAVMSGFPVPDHEVILMVGADGSYELVRSQARPGSFRLAVELYRDAGRIQRECNQARKAAA